MRLWKLFAGILLWLWASAGYGQQPVVTISPKKPEVGDTLTISYHPRAASAQITNPDSVFLMLPQITSFFQEPHQQLMEDEGDQWSISLPVRPNVSFSSFYFKSGNQTDKGPDNHQYEILVYDDGKPMEEALTYKRRLLSYRYSDAQTLDSLQRALLQRQVELYPDNFYARVHLMDAQIDTSSSDSTDLKQQALEILHRNHARYPDSSAVVDKVIRGYDMLGEKHKADSLRQAFIANHPHSSLALKELRDQLLDTQDAEAKVHILKTLAYYSHSPMGRASAYNRLFEYYKKHHNTRKMADYAYQAASTPWPKKASQLNNFARGFAQENDSLKLALLYAEKALKAIPKEIVGPVVLGDVLGKGQGPFMEGYIPDSVAEKKREQLRSDIYATIGFIQLKRKNFEVAETYLTKAVQNSDSKRALESLGDLYYQTGRPRKAYDTYRELLLKDPTQESLQRRFQQAYIRTHSSKEGYQRQFAKLKKTWRQQMRGELSQQRLNKPLPAFSSVVDLRGEPFSQEALTNKVTVVTLWASWCEQCLRILPDFQQLYQEYKNNPNVRFMALNTGNGDTFKEAKTWVKHHDFDLPWYYDKQSSTTKKLQLKGIPNIFFIGKSGRIRFVTHAANRAAFVPKLKLRIEMLLDR